MDNSDLLASASSYNFGVKSVKDLYIASPRSLQQQIDNDTAKTMFFEWLLKYNRAMWRPVDTMTRNSNMNRLEVIIAKDETVVMKNTRVSSQELKTGDKIYALPPLFCLVRQSGQIYTIRDVPDTTFVLPMLLTESDILDFNHDYTLCSMLRSDFDLKKNGKSCFKQFLSQEEMIVLGNNIHLNAVGVVGHPVYTRNSALPGQDNTVPFGQRFHLRLKPCC